MTATRNRPSLGLALAVAILALPVGVGSASAAEQPSAQDIIDAWLAHTESLRLQVTSDPDGQCTD